MTLVVTSNATILCSHGGRVQLIPRQLKVTIQGGSVLCEPDLVGAPIVGCAQAPSPSTKPCTLVVSTFPGSSSLVTSADGRPVYLASLGGITDGVPPGSISVVDAGQTAAQA